MSHATGIFKTVLSTITKIKFLWYTALLILSTSVYGQDMLTATIANQQIHDFQRERIRSEYEQEKSRINENNRKTNQNSNSKTAGNYSEQNFYFKTDNNVVQQVERKIIANLKRKNPISGKNLGETLARDKPYPKYLVQFKKLGLDGYNNYADVFTAYILGMWRIANQIEVNPTTKDIQAVRRQVMNSVVISNLTNQQRQEKAAYLIYDLIFANESYEASRKANDFKLLKSDSDEVNNRFLRANNMNLRNMKITENGLRDKQ